MEALGQSYHPRNASRIKGLIMEWHPWRRKQRDTDLNDEIAHDLAADVEDRMRAGISHDEAEQASRRAFGNVLLLKEDIREIWGWTSLERFAQDFRYGWRTLFKNPLFTTMAVLSFALGIGANTVIYSVMDAIMIRALPVRNPGELVILNWRAKPDPPVVQSHTGSSYDEPDGGQTSPDFPWPAYEHLRNENGAFSTLFARKDAGQLNLVVQGQAELGQVEFVSGNFFSGLGIVPATGRLISDRMIAPAHRKWRFSVMTTGATGSPKIGQPLARRCASTTSHSRLWASPRPNSSGLNPAQPRCSTSRFRTGPLSP